MFKARPRKQEKDITEREKIERKTKKDEIERESYIQSMAIFKPRIFLFL